MTQTTLNVKPASKKRAKPDSEDEDPDDDNDDVGDDSVLSSTPPNAKKAKKAPGPKKGASKPLADVSNESVGADGANEPAPSKSFGAADKYQKVDHLLCLLSQLSGLVG